MNRLIIIDDTQKINAFNLVSLGEAPLKLLNISIKNYFLVKKIIKSFVLLAKIDSPGLAPFKKRIFILLIHNDCTIYQLKNCFVKIKKLNF